MATNKEEVLFKVKAELSGFKKSMDELKKMAKETSKNVKKSMNMDLSKEGSNAGKTFINGFDREIKTATDSIKLELKALADQAANIKISFDTSGIEYVKRQLADITVNVSTDSDRAKASMSNNANAPNNGMNTMASIANSGALTKLTDAMNNSTSLIKEVTGSIKEAGDKVQVASESIDKADAQMKATEDSIKVIGESINKTGESINKTGDSINNTGDLIKNTGDLINSANDSIKNTVDSIKGVNDSINNTGELIKSTNDSIKSTNDSIKSTSDSMNAIGDKVNSAGENIKSAANIIQDSNKVIEAAGDKFRDASEQVKDISNKMSDVYSKIDSSSEMINSAGKDILSASESIESSSKNMTEAGKSIDSAANKIKNAKLNVGTKDVPEIGNINELSNSITKASNNIDSAASKIEDASNAIDEAGSKIDDSGSRVEDAGNAIDKAADKIKDITDKFNLACSNIAALGASINTASEIMANTINKIAPELKNAIENVVPTIKNAIIEAIKEGSKSIGQETTKAVNTATKKGINTATKKGIDTGFLNKSIGLGNALFGNNQKDNQPHYAKNIYDLMSPRAVSESLLNNNAGKELELLEKYKKEISRVQNELKKTTINSDKGELLKSELQFYTDIYKEINKVVEQINKKSQEAKAKIEQSIDNKDINDLTKIASNEIGKLSRQQENLEKAIEKTKKELSGLEKGTEVYDKVESKLSRQVEVLERVKAKLQECKNLSRGAFDELSVSIDDANESAEKLRMNLTLLSSSSGNDDILKKIDEAIEAANQRTRKLRNEKGREDRGFGTEDYRELRAAQKQRDILTERHEKFKEEVNIGDIGSKAWSEINDALKNAISDVNKRIEELKKSFDPASAIEAQIEQLEDTLLEFSSDPKDVNDEFKQEFRKILSGIEEEINNLSDEYGDVFKQELREWFRSVKGLADENITRPSADETYESIKAEFRALEERIMNSSFDSDVYKKGLIDTLKQEEGKLDESNKKRKNDEFIVEFKKLIERFEKLVVKSSSDDNFNQNFKNSLNEVINRIDSATNKSSNKDILLEFEAIFKQLADRINSAPTDDFYKQIYKNVFKRVKEEIDKIYKAQDIDLNINLPMLQTDTLNKQFDNFRRYMQNSNINLPILRVDEIKDQFDQLRDYMNHANINLPILRVDTLKDKFDQIRDYINHSDINLPILRSDALNEQFDEIRKSIEDAYGRITAETREAEQETDSFTGKLKKLYVVLNQQNAQVFTHRMGQLKEKINDLKTAASELVQPFKKAFNGMSNIINRLLSPIKKVASGFRNIGNEAKTASVGVDKLKGSFTGLLSKLSMYFGIYELFGLMKQGTEDAIKYESQILNIQRTFGKASKSLTDFANKNAVSWGLSKQQVAEYGNIFGVIVKNINVGMAEAGASSDAIAKSTMNTTQELLKSAGMISSALGYDVETVLEGLRSGILGSSEAVDQFGLNLKQANLEASQAFMEVSNNGQIAWNNLTEAQRQYVITQEIINQTTRNFGQVLGQNGKIMQTTAGLQAQYMAQLANTKLALGNLGKVLWTAILPPLTKILQVLEVVFNYAAAAMTALLGLFGIQVDFSSPSSAGGALTGMQNSLSNMEDTATNVADNTKYALNSIGDSATDSANKTEKAINKTEKVGKKTEKAAKKTEEAVKKVKRALAGFDQINVLNIKEDDNKKDDTKINKPKKDKSKIDKPKIDNPIGGFNPDDFKPTPLNPSDFGVQMPDITPQFKSNLDKFKDFADKMKKLLNELTEPFKKAWDFLGDRWIAAWNRLKKEFKNFCDSLAKFLKSVWDNGGKEFVQHMAEIALACGIAAMEIGGTILHALAELWKHLDPETNGHTQAFLDALNETAIKLRDLILSINGYLENLMNNGGQEVLNAFGDMLMDLGTTAARVFGVIIDAIQGLLEHLFGVNEAGQLTNEITKSMLEAWENAFRSIGDAALAFADLMESVLVNGGQDIVNSLGDLAMQIAATIGTIVDEVAQSMAALFDHMDPAKNDISKGALEGFKYFIDSITGFVRMLGESLGTFMDNGGQEFVNNVGDIVAILIDLASTIAGDIINSITAFMNSWAGQTLIAAAARALQLISSVLKGFLEILKPLTPVISGVVAGILAFMGATKVIGVITKVVSVFKSVGSVIGIAKAAASALWAVLMANPIAAVIAAVVALGVALVAAYNKFDGFREAVDKILDAFSGLGEALKSAFSNILKDVTNIFQDVIDIIVGIFTGDGERVGEAVRSLVENILQLLWDVTTGVLDIGINLVTGLAKGIWEAIKQAPKLIGDALTGLADFIKDFFKGLFGIHSPSTVFAEYGGYLVEGLADGITKAFDKIGDAFNSMFKYVKDKVSKITDGIKSGFKAIKDFVIPLPKMAWDKLKETAGNIVNKIKEKVEKFKAKLPKPSVVWDSIKTTAGKAIDNVKRVVQGFKSKLPKPSVMWDSLKTGVSNALNKIKDFMDRFKWKLPKPKLPKFSVSGGEAPWGFMGKGSLPKVDVKWNKAGGIMTSATIFGMAGNTLLGGGEAGSEGIIPLDELWNQLNRQFQQQNAILSSIVASGSGNSNRPVNITLKINDIEMGKAVISSLKALSNHGGTIDLPI